MAQLRTQVGIVGAGPAGLLLAERLRQSGIDSIVLERQTRAYVEGRIRAGVLEHGTVALLESLGAADRLHLEGLRHDGTVLRSGGRDHRVDLRALTGRSITVYGQHEVVSDLIAARLRAGAPIRFEATASAIDLGTAEIRFRQDGDEHVLRCDFIAGCDGFHGVCREAVPAGALTIYERVYPFAWLGILAATAPPADELIYARHRNGFALASMRSLSVSRLYLQCAPDADPAEWSNDRIWSELELRLATGNEFRLGEGSILQKGVTAMRSFVAEPLRHGKLFLLGDAAHIVPPTGAKGLNLAAADAALLARGLERYYRTGDATELEGFSPTALRRIWRVQRFSAWMTTLLHEFPGATEFDRRLQDAELMHLDGSEAAATAFAESYVGLPIETA